MTDWNLDIKAVEDSGNVTVEFIDFLNLLGRQPLSYTAAQIADQDERVNNVDKRVGKMIWDSTNSLPYWATGTGKTDAWKTWSGTITPS